MRKTQCLNDGWTFEKQGEKSTVSLPHSFNACDGQGEQPTYYRGVCTYTKVIKRLPGRVYVEFDGVNSTCTVSVNGKRVSEHHGGYSRFRFDITDFLDTPSAFLTVEADNRPNKRVYPENADFTFYGGIYRSARLIYDVPETHFSLDDCGSQGVYVTAHDSGLVKVKALITNYVPGVEIKYEVLNADGQTVASAGNLGRLFVRQPILWDGVENPYLYTLRASLVKDGETIDVIEQRFGFRSIRFDDNEGCFLNGRHIKLKGVSRHQDRLGIGNALLPEHHAEDLEIIKSMGANSVRLAHYQQSQEIYSLCDELGLLVWAEVPVISRFSEKKQENALCQLEELIKQNMHHPSIYCWSVANEITMQGDTKKLAQAIEQLNDLAHLLDPSRPTVMAQLTMLGCDSRLNDVTDILGYNHYFGWYVKTYEGIDRWLDEFRRVKPERGLCLSEYGAEAVLGYFSDNPSQGDYSEGYQALLHEHYLNAINERPWVWGSYVWNMFDFGSSMRNEGGVRGRNNKGLVSFDRKVKKDSYYLYKAYWSEDKFVYLQGSRYKIRTVGEHTMKVYSNYKRVKLTCGDYQKTLTGEHVFTFENVPIAEGENEVIVSAGRCSESYAFTGAEQYPREYSLPDGSPSMVRNWFLPKRDEINPEYYSTDDYIGDILKNEEISAMAKNLLGTGALTDALAAVFGRVRLSSVLRLKIPGLNDEIRGMVGDFLQTVKKK